MLHYIVDAGRNKLLTGWQEENEVAHIIEWGKINDIKNILSSHYSRVLSRFDLRGFTEVSAVTSSGNTKEVKLKEAIASNILDLPSEVITIIDEVVKNNFFEYKEEDTIQATKEEDLPF